MYRYICILLMSISAMAAEATRIKATKEAADGVYTCWGTCFAVSKDHILTANHVIDGKTEFLIDNEGVWSKATLIKVSKDLDIALLKVEHKLDVLPIKQPLVVIPASLKAEPVRILKAEPIVFNVKYTVGGSGAPVILDGNIIGMATTGENVIDGATLECTSCRVVPSSVLNEFLK